MKTFKVIIFFLLLITQGYSFADNSSRKEAEILLSTMGMDTALEQTIEKMLDIQLQQNVALAPFKQIMLKFFKKHMNYESLKPDMINIYADAFTASELREIIAFYKTPTGEKTIKLMPELAAKGGQLGAQRVQENMQELQQMIKAESERIKQLQNE